MGRTSALGKTKASEASLKVYPVGLTGESNYQEGIARTHPGEVARVFHEHDNPYDSRALRVENNIGDILGYIPKGSWLQRAVHDDGLGLAATIKSISDGNGSGMFGVVLDVTLTDDPVFTRDFKPARLTTKAKKAAPTKVEQAEADLGLIRGFATMIKVPFNCECGSSYNANYLGLHSDTEIWCPDCHELADLSNDTLDRLDAEFHALVGQMLASEKMKPIDIDAIRALRLNV